MSEIDSYKHRILGRIDFDREGSFIPIYQLLEDVPIPKVGIEQYEPVFYGLFGMRGDILLGGGSGELAAMRVNTPLAFEFFTHNLVEFSGVHSREFVQPFWTMNQAYFFISEYKKIGYIEETHGDIELWLCKNIIKFLIKDYFDEFKQYIGEESNFDIEDSICRLFTKSEKNEITWAEITKTQP